MIIVLWKSLPELAPKEKISYGALIGDVFKSLARYPRLKWVLVSNGLVFGIVFNLFWNAVTFLLSANPFGFSTFQIGLVSLAGVVGAVGSIWVGKLQDRGVGVQAVGAFIALSLAAMITAFFSGSSVVLLVVAAAVYSPGVQGAGTLDQVRAMSLDPSRSSRLNTISVFNNFVCSAIGSALSGLVWAQAGWPGTCLAATAAIVIAGAAWLASRRA